MLGAGRRRRRRRPAARGATASFEPLVLAEADQRILGSNYGSVRPAVDIPALVDRFMTGDLRLHELISARATAGGGRGRAR